MSDAAALPPLKRTALRIAIEAALTVARSLLPPAAAARLEYLIAFADRDLAARPGPDRKAWVLEKFWAAPEARAAVADLAGWLVSLLIDLIVARLRLRATAR